MVDGSAFRRTPEHGESDMGKWVVPDINLERCTRCGTCVERCPVGAVEMGPVGPFIARPEDCTYCALCEDICPEGAISLGYEITWGNP
ncbi:MAG: 4Fe-4S binding protein [Anaerolineae bacterium]|nr:4Fe-4S binding protein [Anaerolineae bacterium]